MGILDGIFGSKSKATTSQQPTLLPSQRSLLEALLQELTYPGRANSDLLGNAGFGGEPYSKPLVADISKQQGSSLAALEQLSINAAQPQEAPYDQAAIDAMMKALSGNSIATDEYIKTNVEDPATRYFTEELLPNLTRRFSGSNAFGSDRMKAEKNAIRDLSQTVTQTSADIRYKASQDALSNALQALGIIPALTTAKSNAQAQQAATIEGILNAQGLIQGTEQAKLTADYQDFLRTQTDKQAKLRAMLELLGIKGFENITTVTPGQSGLLGGLVQGAGAGLAKGLFS